ncbi:uncharacterized protein G2W53_040781 [Senna tora]|uniref:Uncharacterized protein n=1 Tax=Senna tora TaxID=362788 RepID=A0A834SCS5_9FABA|nr:uncharacterized protein G2W53_040781 [Senna tora]
MMTMRLPTNLNKGNLKGTSRKRQLTQGNSSRTFQQSSPPRLTSKHVLCLTSYLFKANRPSGTNRSSRQILALSIGLRVESKAIAQGHTPTALKRRPSPVALNRGSSHQPCLATGSRSSRIRNYKASALKTRALAQRSPPCALYHGQTPFAFNQKTPSSCEVFNLQTRLSPIPRVSVQ